MILKINSTRGHTGSLLVFLIFARPGSLHFPHIADYVYNFYPLSDPDVGYPVFIRDVEHSSVNVGLCDRRFVLCLFGDKAKL